MVPPLEETTVSLPFLLSCCLHWLPHLLTCPFSSSHSLLPQTLQVQGWACQWCACTLGIGGPSPIGRRALPWLRRWWQTHGRSMTKQQCRGLEHWSTGCMESTFAIWLAPNTHNKTHHLDSSLCLLALDNYLLPPVPNVGVLGGTSSIQVHTGCSGS
jgi:hypothetical protein